MAKQWRQKKNNSINSPQTQFFQAAGSQEARAIKHQAQDQDKWWQGKTQEWVQGAAGRGDINNNSPNNPKSGSGLSKWARKAKDTGTGSIKQSGVLYSKGYSQPSPRKRGVLRTMDTDDGHAWDLGYRWWACLGTLDTDEGHVWVLG